jgi:adenine-specific DNA-methyltransferase
VASASQLALGIEKTAQEQLAGLIRYAAEWAGGLPVDGLSEKERDLLTLATDVPVMFPAPLPQTSEMPDDPLAAALLRIRPLNERRELGQFLTPLPIVKVMVDWVKRKNPGQVVDAGCGTGRFAIAAARQMPSARIIAVDSDPVATLLCRAYVQRFRLDNVEVRCADFLADALPLDESRAAFIGNPPYVRHHRLPWAVKQWGARASERLGVPFSKLAGLHAYFFLATALRARAGDVGCYITSAEWLDVRYGKNLRELLRENLGVISISVLAESAAAFDDAMTTAAVTCFEVGRKPNGVRFSVVPKFRFAQGPADAATVAPDALLGRWGLLLRDLPRAESRRGWLRLGDLASVHRGIATGANEYFVMTRAQADGLGLASCVKPVITAGEQVLNAGGSVETSGAKVLLALPRDLDKLPPKVRDAARRYLAKGEKAGIPDRYLCSHRRPWWWLGDAEAPPIVASYMARRPPAFALNPDGALILNIAHGVFPREPMTASQLSTLVKALNRAAPTFVGNGRRYQGGLEKFEPREMEDLRFPPFGRRAS